MEELIVLKQQYEQTTDFMEKNEILSMIEDLEILHGIKLPSKPIDSDFECWGCGS